jgi:hypothetical protein
MDRTAISDEKERIDWRKRLMSCRKEEEVAASRDTGQWLGVRQPNHPVI